MQCVLKYRAFEEMRNHFSDALVFYRFAFMARRKPDYLRIRYGFNTTPGVGSNLKKCECKRLQFDNICIEKRKKWGEIFAIRLYNDTNIKSVGRIYYADDVQMVRRRK